MTIAREEIFGPVLSIIAYKDEEEAIRIANDTPYGLSGYVPSGDSTAPAGRARSIRAGNVHINGAGADFDGALRRLQAVRQRPRMGRSASRSSSKPNPSSAGTAEGAASRA